MVEFFVGNIYGKRLELNILFKQIMKENPLLFNDGYKISAVYGSFENSIWNGGRVNDPFDISFDEIKKYINLANENDLSVRYTFSNALIMEKYLNDETSNTLMKIANNGKNGVIVASEILHNYLKNTYPNFHYVYSTTNCSLNAEDYNKNYDNYDILVLDWRVNKDKDFLFSLKGREKIEIMVNLFCPLTCKNARTHYIGSSAANLGFNGIKKEIYCSTKIETEQIIKKLKESNQDVKLYDYYAFFNAIKNNNKNMIRKEELKWYIDNGFNKFKLTCRHSSFEYIIFNYIYYFAKNEYLNEIFDILKETKFGKYSEFVRKDLIK